jgi:hypothetical protein
VAYETELK